ncbi:MAG: decarboxylase, partial [Candidatus Nanoarchaeia archaeon]
GLTSVYANTNKQVLQGIFKKITLLKKFCNTLDIRLMIEPGRFISAPAIKLITYIKRIYNNTIIVDASVYNTDMDALIVPVKLLVRGELNKQEARTQNVKPWVVKGITPCSLDLFRYKVYLKNPQVGDELIFENAGAYNFTTTFCDLPQIPTKVLQ